MTYRQDSDFHHPYGHIVQIKNHTKDPKELDSLIQGFGVQNKNLANGKTKGAAWFVSNCDSMSKRENYVNELQKYIPVSDNTIIKIEQYSFLIWIQYPIWS